MNTPLNCGYEFIGFTTLCVFFVSFDNFRNGKVLLQYLNLRVVSGRELVIVGTSQENYREKPDK